MMYDAPEGSRCSTINALCLYGMYVPFIYVQMSLCLLVLSCSLVLLRSAVDRRNAQPDNDI
jgi:hypothetical protein